MSRLILGSGSPRRAALLRQAGFAFEQRPVQVDESPQTGESGIVLVERLAQAKAAACLEAHPEAVVLAADTVALRRTGPCGKPASRGEYAAMMQEFSDAAHTMLSGVCIRSRSWQRIFHCATEVRFSLLPPEWVETYWQTGEPRDCAGGYAIQGGAESYVCEIRGSYTNVMGLPICETRAVLAEAGIRPIL